MKKQPAFGGAIPKDQWIARTVTQDPAPRMSFSNAIRNSPAAEPSMTMRQKIAYGIVFGFAIGVIVLVP